MPNICENWVHLTASEATINALMSKPFSLNDHFPPPTDLDGDKLHTWFIESFSTNWIANESRDGPPQIVQKGPTPLIVDFISS